MSGMEKMPIDYANAILHWWWAIVAAFTALFASPIVYAILRDRKRKRNLTEIRKRNFAQWAAWVQKHDALPVVNTSLMLGGGEVVHHAANAKLMEPRAVRVSNHGGAGFDVGGGVIVGGGRSISESRDEWRQIAAGQVFVTSRRVIFAGDKANRAVGIDSIMALDADADGVVISSDSRQKPLALTDTNGLIIRAAIQILRGVEADA